MNFVTEPIAFRLLLGILIFCPLAFGTVETWSVLVMEAGLFSALLLLFIRRENHHLLKIPGILPLGGMLVYIFIQAVPLPPLLIRMISPSASAIYSTSLWAAEPDAWATLSLYPKGTVSEFLRLASYAAAYILTAELLSEDRRLRRFVVILAVFGSALAFFSIIQQLTANGKIYWIRELTQGGTPYGPYVNRNHYAGLMGMLFPVVMVLFMLSRPHSREETLRRKVSDLIDRSLRNEHLLFGLGAVVMALSIFLSLSRGGVMSFCVSVALLGFLLSRRIISRKGGVLLVVTVIVILYAVGWFGWGPVFERFRSIRSVQGEISELRFGIWKDSLGLIRDYPATGTGAGSFIHVYPAYRTIRSDRIAEHVHNDYLELLTDGGLVAAGLFAWFLVSVISISYRIFLLRKDPYARHLFSGAVAGVAAFLFHAITDFNFYIGANGLFLFVMLGLAASSAGLRSANIEMVSAPFEDNRSRRVRKTIILASGLLLTASILFNMGQIFSSVLRTDASRMSLQQASHENTGYFRDTLERAVFLDPLEPLNHYLAGLVAAGLSDKASERRHLLSAIRMSPAEASYLQAVGSFFDRTGDVQSAEKFYSTSVARAPTEPAIIRNYGIFLLGTGKKDAAIQQFRTALSYEPAKISKYISLLVLEGLSDKDILSIIPNNAASHTAYAEHLYSTGSRDKAADIYQRIINLDPKNDAAKKRLKEIRG